MFDDDMKAQLASDAGVKTLTNMLAANAASIPGNNELDAVSLWAACLQGKVAMIYSWPPTGPHDRRLLAERQGDQLRPAVDDRRQGRLRRRAGQSRACDRLQQGALGRLRQSGSRLSLHAVGDCSPPVSLARCMLPYALRDPYRLSHFKSDLYAALFPTAKEYLANLNNSANVGLLDPIMPGAQDYFLEHRPHVHRGLGRRRSRGRRWRPPRRNGTRRPSASASTRRRRSTPEFLKLPGATADNTVEKLGMAVKL